MGAELFARRDRGHPDRTRRSLNKAALTLLVIDAFAAAIIGRLRSLPLTFAGAILIGMVKSYSATFLVLGGRWFGLQNALPAIVLLVALFFVPYDRLDTSRADDEPSPVPRPDTSRGRVGLRASSA